MRLVNRMVQRGQWLKIEGASQTDLAPKYITLGGVTKPVYVDGNNYQVRCPNIEPGSYTVLVGDIDVGTVAIY